jgi:hypothetical protein
MLRGSLNSLSASGTTAVENDGRRIEQTTKLAEMSLPGQWLLDFLGGGRVDGLVPVEGFPRSGPSEVIALFEKARDYGADAVFFEAGRNGRPDVPQAFIFKSKGPSKDAEFAETHRKLWSWGGVPLAYRVQPGLVQLFRCAHRPDFLSEDGTAVCNPFQILNTAGNISADPWWNAELLRNGALWDDPKISARLANAEAAAHHSLFEEIKSLYEGLNEKQLLPAALRRKLLILCLMIAYLEERKVLLPEFFGKFRRGADHFFNVLDDGKALVSLLEALEERFNGNLFSLSTEDKEKLKSSNGQLARFAAFVEGTVDNRGQINLWRRYSFEDLPVELISQVYQLFVKDPKTAVYTPAFLVRLMLDEVLSPERMDLLLSEDEIILDPSCGSCVFLVEAYKRLVLHWRSRNSWQEPKPKVLHALLEKVHGIDVDEGAVELGAFSLCLALCDALKPEAIRGSFKLFPILAGKTLHHSCFFEAKAHGLLNEKVGVVIGNPPFESEFQTDGGKAAYQKYISSGQSLPDKQVAYLFLHEAMDTLVDNGVLCLLQQYNFLYNLKSLDFRRAFFSSWQVREILDFISVRGLFTSGGADTKVLVIVAEKAKPSKKDKVLHATFRRSGRIQAELGFEIDYYDLHWIGREMLLTNDGIWRANLLGGSRALALGDRLRAFPTIGDFVQEKGWQTGEGFTFGNPKDARPSDHVVGKDYIQSRDLHDGPITKSHFPKVPVRPIQWPRREGIFTAPLLLIHKHEDLRFGLWEKGYLTYQHTMVGISAAGTNGNELRQLALWLREQKKALQAAIASTGAAALASKATAILSDDILSLPYPKDRNLDLSSNEKILIEDIVTYFRDFVRTGEKSELMRETGFRSLPRFVEIFTSQINAIYRKASLVALPAQRWAGILCQPFAFGNGRVDWSEASELKGKLDSLLTSQGRPSLRITRITRIYDESFIFLVKPDRLRFWLRSVALRDADETLADLRSQGF